MINERADIYGWWQYKSQAFLLVPFIANKILNRNITRVRSKSIMDICGREGMGEWESCIRKKKNGKRGNEGQKLESRVESVEEVWKKERGNAELTSTWFSILLYSVLRASRVTRTCPS